MKHLIGALLLLQIFPFIAIVVSVIADDKPNLFKAYLFGWKINLIATILLIIIAGIFWSFN